MPKTSILFAVFLAMCLSIKTVLSAESPLKQELKVAYKKGQFGKAEEAGRKAVTETPGDGEARYYLANALVKLGKNEEAIEQYRLCRSRNQPANIRRYAGRALEQLLTAKERALSAGTNTQQPRKTQDELRQYERRLAAEQREEENRIRNDYEQAREHLSSSYDSRRYNSYGRPSPSQRMQDSMHYHDELRSLEENYRRKIDDLREHFKDALSQTNCGTGNIRVVPALSSSKVKNYINYSDQSEADNIPKDNPLTAQTMTLSNAPVKKSSVGNKNRSGREATHKPKQKPTLSTEQKSTVNISKKASK